jgi:uncharacterized protein YkwD
LHTRIISYNAIFLLELEYMLWHLIKRFLFWLITIVAVLIIATRFLFPNFFQNKILDNLTPPPGQTIFTSGPLSHFSSLGAKLDANKVIELTNQERTNNNLPVLSHNTVLDKAANAKMQDMFKQQYFEHISPDGRGPSDVVTTAGYKYIVVGENLAMGLFSSDKDLVDAWMASPGHRANILHNKFTEIGVAVGEGNMNGKKVWLAVQEFGRPLNLCPEVDSTLRDKIETEKAEVNSTQVSMEVERKILESNNNRTQAQVDDYNNRLQVLRTKNEQLQSDLRVYNTQVGSFNSCIGN